MDGLAIKYSPEELRVKAGKFRIQFQKLHIVFCHIGNFRKNGLGQKWFNFMCRV
jgi:hypothetical protein